MMTMVHVGKSDLRGWSTESVQVILWAQEQGARVRISSRGHARLLGPDGRTAGVAAKLPRATRASLNAWADARRLVRGNPQVSARTKIRVVKPVDSSP